MNRKQQRTLALIFSRPVSSNIDWKNIESLTVFLDMCKEDGAEPYRKWSGRFNVRIDPRLHANLAAAAKGKGKSLNVFVAEALEQAVSCR